MNAIELFPTYLNQCLTQLNFQHKSSSNPNYLPTQFIFQPIFHLRKLLMARRPTVTFNLSSEQEELLKLREHVAQEEPDKDEKEQEHYEDDYEEELEDEEEEEDDEDPRKLGNQSGHHLWYDVTDSDSEGSTQEYLESLAALRQLKRDSVNRRTSSISMASAFIREALQANDADDTWSLKYLRRRFERKDQETLFVSYQLRLRHVFFLVYLMLQMMLTGVKIVAILYFIMNDKNLYSSNNKTESYYLPELICRSLILCVCLFIFCFNHNEKSFKQNQRFHFAIAILMLGTLFFSNFALSLYVLLRSNNADYIVKFGNIIYILLVGYAFVPLKDNLHSTLTGMTITAAYVTFCFVSNLQVDDPALWQKAACDVIVLSMANLAGMYTRYVNEITFRRVFLNRKGNLEAKIKLEKTKQQEEPLLLSVLPKAVMQMVREDYRRYIYEGKLNSSQLFRNRYLSRHSNVSILYADIVNFTILTTILQVDKLVEVLNDLFDQFDHEAEKNDCLRIKILGDCYYCVSGLPEETPMHANNCIRMGLRMIDIIRKVRLRFEEDVNMRIGIHSGTVLCGIIGSLKFQYDVWGEDVTIANRMEQTGKVGRVHISGQTLAYVENAEFEVEKFGERDSDELLVRKNVESFLVLPKRKRLSMRRRSSAFQEELTDHAVLLCNPDCKSELFPPSVKEKGSSPLSQSIENDIQRCYKQSMDEAIKSMPLKKTDQWFRTDDINPLLLTFTREPWNVPLLLERDVLFKFYLYSCLPFALGLTILQEIVMPGVTWSLILGLSSFLILFIIVIPIVYVSLFPDKEKEEEKHDKHDGKQRNKITKEEKQVEEDDATRAQPKFSERDLVKKLMYASSYFLTDGFWVRTLLYFFCMILLSAVAFANMIECERIIEASNKEREFHILSSHFRSQFGQDDVRDSSSESNDVIHNSRYLEFEGRKTTAIPPLCCNPWYFTFSCNLVLLASFGFLRTFFLIKLLTYLLISSIYTVFVLVLTQNLFDNSLDLCPSPAVSGLGLHPPNNHLISVGIIILALHIIDRQMEYFMRLNFKWKQLLRREQEEAEKARKVNATLLENIMPRHVAEYFLTRAAKQNLYHENHSWVAVVFASIPNFSDFYRTNRFGGGEDDDQGEKSLQVLNAIIIDFDELKVDPRFCAIEKIKVIGSTYMAACGLQLNTEDGVRPGSQDEGNGRPGGRNERCKVVNTLTSFAAAMFGKLEKVNEESWQNFGLRVGIDVGPVIAGVLGNQKPHYDIWGNAVNVASRMDANGQIGKIHVTEEVGTILEDLHWSVTKRGSIFVKGKGQMVTYFVDPKSDPTQIVPKLSIDSSIGPILRSILKPSTCVSLSSQTSDDSRHLQGTEPHVQKSGYVELLVGNESLLDEKDMNKELVEMNTSKRTNDVLHPTVDYVSEAQNNFVNTKPKAGHIEQCFPVTEKAEGNKSSNLTTINTGTCVGSPCTDHHKRDIEVGAQETPPIINSQLISLDSLNINEHRNFSTFEPNLNSCQSTDLTVLKDIEISSHEYS